MSVLYPPVLENKAMAIPYVQSPNAEDFYTIEFKMPDLNVIEEIKHIQVSIKAQSTGESAVSPAFSPDRQVLYIDRGQGAAFFVRRPNGNYAIQIPYRCFAGGRPTAGSTYMVQVRFGSNILWDPVTNGLDGLSFGNFAGWRALATSTVPSSFGEWSNIQTVYCYGPATVDLSYNLNDFVPEIVYKYAPVLDDPLEQCKVVYQYADMYGSTFETLVFNGQYQQDGTYIMRAKLPLAPVQKIYVSLEAVTKNNTLRGGSIIVLPQKTSHLLNVYQGSMVDAELTGEENYDAVLSKTFVANFDKQNVQNDDLAEACYSVYRSNVYTLETIKVIDNQPLDTAVKTTFKDFTVEMGEDYQYTVTVNNKFGKVLGTIGDIYPWGYGNPGYGRLTFMEGVFLTTRKHQLRLTGGVNVSAFKRNTQDQFTPTIGSQYPFYSRGAKTNYRSFSLNGLVSIIFDPTATFLRNDVENGLWWEDNNGQSLAILNRDLYGEQQFSISRRRMQDMTQKNNHSIQKTIDWQANYGPNRDVFGPATIYDDYYYRNTVRNASSDKTDENIYIERKFRDFVMLWLSDGKPKLFRSETEGNMIVMLSGASFTPQDKSARMVYNVSMTVTEIAEYNLQNLIAYDLVPVDIKSVLVSGFPRNLKRGDIIEKRDFNALILLQPSLEFGAFIELQDGNYKVEANIDLINDTINQITDYTFIRGDDDTSVSDALGFRYSKIFDIPDSMTTKAIRPIDLKPGVKNGLGELKFEVVNGILPDGLELTSDGIIRGTPTLPGNNPRPRDKVTIQVTDTSKTGIVRTATMMINVGLIYSELKFSEIDVVLPTTIMTGRPIGNISLMRYISGGVKFTEDEESDYKDTDYLFTFSGLPDGIEVTNEGILKGSYAFPVAPGSGVITVHDAMGQSASSPITFGEGLYPLFFQAISTFNIWYTEVGQPMDPINVSIGVSGGYKKIDENWPTGYRFYAEGLPQGMVIEENTGIIRGAEYDTENKTWVVGGPPQSAGKAIIIVRDFDDSVTHPDGSIGNVAQIEITYQSVLAPFTIEVVPELHDIRPGADKANWEATKDNKMTIGTVISPIDFMPKDNATVDNISLRNYVTGGLPYKDKPYYRFSSEGLLPDFKINNKGVITGMATVASPEREATIKVYDARGAERTAKIHVNEITAELSFVPSAPNGYILPPTYVNNQNFEYDLTIPYTDIHGGTPPYRITVVSGQVEGMDIQTEVDVDESKYFTVRGKPSKAETSGKLIIQIEDSTVPVAQAVRYSIARGTIYDQLWWNQKIALTNLQDGQYVEIKLNGITGGLYPYTLNVLDENLGTDETTLSPLEIIQNEGGEQDANKIVIAGYMAEKFSAKKVRVRLTDSMGQYFDNVIEFGPVSAQFAFSKINNIFAGMQLVAGVSQIPGNQNINPVAELFGGTTPYTIAFEKTGDNNGATTDVLISGIHIDQQGNISGTPDTPEINGNYVQSWFLGKDAQNRTIRPTSSQLFYLPQVCKPLSRRIGPAGLIPEVYEIPRKSLKQTYTSDILFESTMLRNCRIEGAQNLPTGLSVRYEGGYYVVTGTFLEEFDQRDVKIDLVWDGNVFTPQQRASITLRFAGCAGEFTFIRPEDLYLPSGYIGQDYTPVTVSDGLRGGFAPIQWRQEGLPAGLSILGNGRTAQIVGRPTQKSSPTIVTIIAIDGTGKQESIKVNFGGVSDALKITYNANMDIPPMNGNTDLIPINLAQLGNLQGAENGVVFKVDASFGDTNSIAPYDLSENGIITGNSGSESFPARKATIRVYSPDENGQYISFQINVGAITGKLKETNVQLSIPPGPRNTPAPNLDLSQLKMGGGNVIYSIESLPNGWTANELRIPNPQNGILLINRPAATYPEGVLEVKIRDNGDDIEFVSRISVGAVT